MDIRECGGVIDSGDKSKAKELVRTIVSAYGNHISNITRELTSCTSLNADYIMDIVLLKKKLEILKADLKDESYKPPYDAKHGLAISNSISSNNSNINENSNMLKNNVSLSFQQVKDDIKNNESIDSIQTSEILSKIEEIENIFKSNDSRKDKWSKLKGCLTWISTKGVDIAVKILPLIIESLKQPA
jgi:hypothetical protein